MSPKDSEFTILALKVITGSARSDEKTRLELLLKNVELKQEYQKLEKFVEFAGKLKGAK
jgi:hypothetical protein